MPSLPTFAHGMQILVLNKYKYDSEREREREHPLRLHVMDTEQNCCLKISGIKGKVQDDQSRSRMRLTSAVRHH